MSEDSTMSLWCQEIKDGFYSQGYRIRQTLFSQKSDFQQIDILDSEGHGKILLIDGLVMLTERDEWAYHEMIAHVPLFTHPDPRSVLVIGGGDGGTVREVLRHPGVEEVVLVEIDGLVVDACRKYLPTLACGLDSPKVTIKIQDGVKFVSQSRKKFDVVIVDSTDPVGPSAPLFNESFYRDVERLLTPRGMVISQAESPFFDSLWQQTLVRSQRPCFEKLHLFNFSNIGYPGGLWSLSFASRGTCPIADFDPRRVLALKTSFKYYNPPAHRAAFALPQFMLDHLGQFLDPLPADR